MSAAGEVTREGSSAVSTALSTLKQEVEEAARLAVRHVRLKMATRSAVLTAPSPAGLSPALDCQEVLEGKPAEGRELEVLAVSGDKRTHQQAFTPYPEEMAPGRLSPLYLAMQR